MRFYFSVDIFKKNSKIKSLIRFEKLVFIVIRIEFGFDLSLGGTVTKGLSHPTSPMHEQTLIRT